MDIEKLHNFFAGTVSEAEGLEIKAWIEASEENKHAFEREWKLYDAIMLHGFLAKDEKSSGLRWKNLTMTWLKIAAVALLTLTFNQIYQVYKTNHEPIAMNTITVPAGQRANLTLSDGTNVWLNARTTMQYPARFTKNHRKVSLSGQAYFNVTKNEKAPFVVQTEKYDIEVLGTQFDVEAYPRLDKFVTTLMEGSVKVFRQERPEHNLVLKPGHKVYLSDGKLYMAQVKDYNPYRWKEGLICFKDASFQSIMDDFEKYYGIKIVIHNKNVLKYSYTGKFRQADGIDYALHVLQKDIRFKCKKDNENQIVYIN